MPTFFEHGDSFVAHLVEGALFDAQRRFHDVLQDRHVGPQVERLEDHAELGADAPELLSRRPVRAHRGPVFRRISSPSMKTAPSLGTSSMLMHLQERRLARTRRADQGYDLPRLGGKTDATQNLKRTEALVHVLHFDDRGHLNPEFTQLGWHKTRRKPLWKSPFSTKQSICSRPDTLCRRSRDHRKHRTGGTRALAAGQVLGSCLLNRPPYDGIAFGRPALNLFPQAQIRRKF